MTAKKTTKKLVYNRNAVGLYEVRYEGGGQVPEELKGKYNSRSFVETAILAYENKKGK